MHGQFLIFIFLFHSFKLVQNHLLYLREARLCFLEDFAFVLFVLRLPL